MCGSREENLASSTYLAGPVKPWGWLPHNFKIYISLHEEVKTVKLWKHGAYDAQWQTKTYIAISYLNDSGDIRN